MIISRTPVRLSFLGGGTDFPRYYERHRGAVLGTTIDKYVYVSLNRLSPFFDYKIRVAYSKSELVNSVEEIAHPSVRECLRFRNINGFLDVHFFSDLPARTGLGSSSSFTVGFLNALYALEGRLVPKKQLADEAIHIEQKMIKENVGSQDQVHASHGGLNVIEFGADGIKIQPLVISREKRELLEQAVMIFYTGETRYAHDVHEEQVSRTESGANDGFLKHMYDSVWKAVEIVSAAEPEAMIETLGRLLHENWLVKKSLASRVSNSLIDGLYERAVAAGAYGGKITGAGGGGFMAFIVPPDRRDQVRNALSGLLEVKFRFEDQGSTIIYMKP
jgi:D-glycero-alpha-D-manno-heptose-7-phosphate kinase